MVARHRYVGREDAATGLPFSCLQGMGNSAARLDYVGNHALRDALGGNRAHAEHVQSGAGAVCGLGYDSTYFVCADIYADYYSLAVWHIRTLWPSAAGPLIARETEIRAISS